MADINDFKVLNLISINYFNTLVSESFNPVKQQELFQLDDNTKSRLGFYILIIEQLTHLADYSDIATHVIDTEFNSILYSTRSDDFGVDAVVVDEEEFHIRLFNFKFRQDYKRATQGVNDTILSSKFLNAINNDDLTQMDGKPRQSAETIKDCLESNNPWKITLYVVSNEDTPNNELDGHLKQFQSNYGMQVISVGLNKIADLISLRPSAVNAKLVVDKNAVMSFSENTLSSSQSYIFRLSLAELVRITSNDEDLRNEYNIEDLNRLSELSLDSSVLFDNVRGFVLKSKYNNNIFETIKTDTTKFFMYNNGLTLIADDVDAKYINGDRKLKVELFDFQVLNGGQTLRTVHNFNNVDPTHITSYLAKAEVLVRVFKTQNQQDLNSEIAEFTNSQNTISNVDLKSLRKEQLALEQYLKNKDILYSRKTGDTGVRSSRAFQLQISMQKFGQILMAYNNKPEKAVNSKKSIFDKYYDELFPDNPTLLEDSVEQIKTFFKIKEAYTDSTVNGSDQKIFYVIHILENSDLDIEAAIRLLEDTIEEYSKIIEESVSKARLLIQKKFKSLIDEKLEQIKDSESNP